MTGICGMGKLLIKICLLFSLVILFCVVFIVSPFLPNDSIQIHQRKQVLLSKVQGRKIVCVGGSGVLHSVSGRLIKERVKGYQVVNMGYNAGLGLRFDIAEVKRFVGAGDIILLTPEYHNYEGGYDGSVLTLLAINSFPAVLKYLPHEYFSRLVASNWWQYVPVKMTSYLDTISSTMANTYAYIDEFGDASVRTTPKTLKNVQIRIKNHGEKYSEMVAILNEFNSYCNSAGAKAYLLYPAFPEGNFQQERAWLMSLHESLTRDTKIPILYSPHTVAYPAALFHDTEYHMTPQGREIHTSKIIGILKKAESLP